LASAGPNEKKLLDAYYNAAIPMDLLRTEQDRITRDRDRPNTFLWMVEFPSAEDAARNNDLPETAGIAEQMSKLCDSGPIFRNLVLLESTPFRNRAWTAG